MMFKKLITASNGIILVTGPTGSGKTTTLYSALKLLNSPQLNILTVEDPVEYQLNGIQQMEVNQKIGLTFAKILPNFLRHDPDIILIGETRDKETAQIAIQSALTGHLVFSTLHTIDSATAFTRLTELGIEPYLVSSAVNAVLAQRLVRKLCPECRVPYTPSEEEFAQLGIPYKKITLYKPNKSGCERCRYKGYKGRLGIYELLIVDTNIRSKIISNAHSAAIKDIAVQNGMKSLFQDGMNKVFRGLTSVEEIYRVINQ